MSPPEYGQKGVAGVYLINHKVKACNGWNWERRRRRGMIRIGKLSQVQGLDVLQAHEQRMCLTFVPLGLAQMWDKPM